MYRLPFVIGFFYLFILLGCSIRGFAQSPHGTSFELDCALCHTDKGWKIQLKDIAFDHNKTRFKLDGVHVSQNCITCHPTLVFKAAETACNSCHEDVHDGTVGFSCEHCHDSRSWLMDNAIEKHEEWGFTLQGKHSQASCDQCHKQEPELRFPPLGQECVSCHSLDYQMTSQPNHSAAGFPMDCQRCHLDNSEQWNPLDHSFFPLTGVHDLQECQRCHDGLNYSSANSACSSCHLENFNQTSNPDHVKSGFSTRCEDCHDLSPGWKVQRFEQHDDNWFPIYSGKHEGEWNACVDCHKDPSDLTSFTCLDCHEHRQSKMDDEHDEVSGYVYESSACLNCHPKGRK